MMKWLKRYFGGSSLPWNGAYQRCRIWESGPFGTDWRCILPADHEDVEHYPHIFEPELWPGGRHHEAWMKKGNPYAKANPERGQQ